jgi:hybrid cluster-associated redox disulfide protein
MGEMHDQHVIEPTVTVDDLLTRYPQTARVFIGHRMHCVGCPFARFHTIADAASLYDMPLALLLSPLQQTVNATAAGASDDRTEIT